MNIPLLTQFLMWCVILNAGLLLLWTVLLVTVPEVVYRTQNKWFPMPRETFTLAMYCFLGAFKIVFLVFNLVPYLALLIVG